MKRCLPALAAILLTLTALESGSCGFASTGPGTQTTTSPAAPRTTVPPATAPVTSQTAKSWSSPPPMTIDQNKKYTAVMETSKGALTLELFARDVPRTVNNFVFLAREGFYDNTIFHRVIAGFMAQGGDPTGTGTGGPGYRFADEFTDRRHVTGALSMANSGANTNGSQFFITYAPQPHLDGLHSVFGQLIAGSEAHRNLVNGDRLIKVTIIEE